MRRVEDVLGKGWENHVEGQRLKADGDSFRQKLNTQELFDDWSRKVGNTPVITLEPRKKKKMAVLKTVFFYKNMNGGFCQATKKNGRNNEVAARRCSTVVTGKPVKFSVVC